MKTSKSSRLFARAQTILPGGVDSPVRAFKAVGGTPLFISARLGARLEDVDGNTLHRLRDVVGTADPRPRAARPGQGAGGRGARDGTSFGAPSPLEVELGERVRRLMPSIERVRFVSSGTEATMSAVRVARAATGREQIVKFEGCYHGHADAFLVQAGSGALTLGVPTSPGVTPAAAADTLVAQLQRPRLGRAGCSTPTAIRSPRSSSSRSPATWAWCRRPTAFCARCASVCDAHGALLIFDEVISGFRASAGRRAGDSSGVAARSDVPREDHRRRPAGRRVRRPRRSDGAGLARRTGLSGGHAVGKSAGDDRRHLVPRIA